MGPQCATKLSSIWETSGCIGSIHDYFASTLIQSELVSKCDAHAHDVSMTQVGLLIQQE